MSRFANAESDLRPRVGRQKPGERLVGIASVRELNELYRPAIDALRSCDELGLWDLVQHDTPLLPMLPSIGISAKP